MEWVKKQEICDTNPGSMINVVEIQNVSSQHLFFSRKEVRL